MPEFEFTPELEKLAHYSSRTGVRTKDREVVIEKSATLRIVMEEWSLENLRMALMGGPAADDGSGNMRFDLLAESEVRGGLRFEGANSVGRGSTSRCRSSPSRRPRPSRRSATNGAGSK